MSDKAVTDPIQSRARAPVGTQNPLGVLCSGCGVCVSEAAGALRMAWDADGFLQPQATGAAAIPATAVRVCPFNPAPEPQVQDEDALAALFLPDAAQYDPQAGRFENSYVGYSIAYRPVASSGGLATYVFDRLLARGDVDYLFVVTGDGDRGYRYAVVDRATDITTMSKTRYYPVTMEQLFDRIAERDGRVAVSGVACFIKAVRLKQHYHPELRAKIPFLVGIICGGLKSRYYTDFLAQSAGAGREYQAPQYRVKNPKSTSNDYSFAATDAQGETHKVRMQSLGDMWGTGLFKSRACDFCTDVTTELADISLGDAWLPEYKADGMGHSVIVTRSALAEEIIQEGIRNQDLVIEDLPIQRVIRSQVSGLQHKQGAVKFRAWMAGQVYGVPVPFVRSRVKADITAAEGLVQILRERTRSRSLQVWRETRDAALFVRRMEATLNRLKAVTAARTKGNINSEGFLRLLAQDPAVLTKRMPIARFAMGRWAVQTLRRKTLTPVQARALAAVCSKKPV